MTRNIALASFLIAVLAACRYEAPAPSVVAEGDVVSLVRSFVERNPNDYVSIYTLARMAERRGDVREATHWLRRLEATSWNHVIEDADFRASLADPAFLAVRDRLNARALVVRGSEYAFDVGELDLLPEGVAYDPTTDRFLVSSGRMRKVVSVGRDGATRDLVGPAQDGLLATLGMKVDDVRRELWVASAAAPFMIDAQDGEAGRSALYAFDADTGETRGSWDVPWRPSLLNDLVVAPDGAVFATESMSGAVLRRLRGAETLDTFLPQETFFSPNGIAISRDGATLFVAHYHGISRVDVRTREVVPIDTADPKLLFGGIDGLYVHDGDLVGIQNLVGKGRVWRIGLDGDRVAAAEILESGNPAFRNPTTGAIANGAFFLLANPNLQEWDGERVSAVPEGEMLQMVWIPLAGSSGVTRLTEGPADDRYPSWSPDGATIAFQRAANDGSMDLLFLDIASGDVRPVTKGEHPAFAPDGRLVYVSGEAGGRDVWACGANGAACARVVKTEIDEQHPDVARSGAIAVTAVIGGAPQVFRLDGTGTPVQVTNDPLQSLWPRWSPDGESILFFSRRDGDDELYLQQAAGTVDVRRITNRAGNDFCPSWSPDGERIAVAFSSEEEDRRIDVVDLSGRVLCSFAESFERVSYPAWSPDGRTIAFAARENGDWDVWAYQVPEGCR